MTTTPLFSSKMHGALFGALLGALLCILPRIARAQTGAVSGTVVAQGTNRPLADVTVTVAGVSGKGDMTDAAGRFTISGLSGSTAVLNVRFIGYRPVTDTVQVGATNIRIALAERALDLNAVIVTGTGAGAQKRELGTSVATVNAADVLAKSAVPTVEGLLNGRAPGVDIIPTSGQVGAGPQIRVRGVGTFSLSSSPLIYIDGVRVNNGQTGIVSRFSDIAPEEIERIEVLKGPAAATLYGTEAARGVINIITKHGAAGPPRYTFSAQKGSQWFNDYEDRMATNYWINPVDDSLWSINYAKTEKARGTPLFKSGGITNLSASASGGSDAYRFYVSGESNDADGITTSNSRAQKNVRANQTITPSDKINIQTNTGYITSRTYTASEGGGPGPLWGEFALPWRTEAACPILYNPVPYGCGLSRGSLVGPPEVYAATQRWQDVRRFTGSASIKYDPFPWMSHRLLIGTDYTFEGINTYLPYQQDDSVIVFFLGSRFDGSRSETDQRTTYNTYDYTGSVHFNVRSNLVSTTTLGVQYYTNHQEVLTASGTHFPSPGLSTISATGVKDAPTSDLIENNTLGAYGQEEFAINDRLFLTGAVRVDNNSAFGSDAKLTTYPKFSVSWVASEEPSVRAFLPGFVDELRLRGAYGGSGQQPLVNSALQTLKPVAGPNGATTLTNDNIGNADLKPERVLGAELGFEAGLFHDRVGIDLTLFRDVARDAILASTVAPSTGFGLSTQYINAGQINKKGLELALKGQIINGRTFGWDMNFNIAATQSKIIRLGAGADTLIDVTGGATGIGTVSDVFQRVGYSPFDLFTYRILSATYDPATKRAINPMCDDGHGGAMPCFAPGGSIVQAPLMYIGHSIPTTTGSWINDFRYGNFRLHVMVDFQNGFRKTDTDEEQVCQALGACLEALQPENYDPKVVASAQNGSGQLQDYFIRPASFAKLREVALSYDAPESLARAFRAHDLGLTISARNLGTRTKYSGLDPETSLTPSSGGLSGNFGTDQTEYPQLRSVVVSLRVTY